MRVSANQGVVAQPLEVLLQVPRLEDQAADVELLLGSQARRIERVEVDVDVLDVDRPAARIAANISKESTSVRVWNSIRSAKSAISSPMYGRRNGQAAAPAARTAGGGRG